MKCGGLYVAGGEAFKVIGQRGADKRGMAVRLWQRCVDWATRGLRGDRGVPGR